MSDRKYRVSTREAFDAEVEEWIEWVHSPQRIQRHPGEPAPVRSRVVAWLAACEAECVLDRLTLNGHRGDLELWRARDDARVAAARLRKILADRGGFA